MEDAEIAVLLVDDQDLVRSGLRRILRRKDGFVIVAECSGGDQVPEALAPHRPDVVVMDLRMKRSTASRPPAGWPASTRRPCWR